MDQQKLTKLLHLQEKEIANATTFCPSGYEVAALFENNLDDSDYERFERHLADCSYCQARTAVLARLHRNTDDEQIPDALMAAADKFGNQPRRVHLRRAPAWATAAVVVIALFAIAGQRLTLAPDAGVQRRPASPLGEDTRQLRNISRSKLAPAILAPIRGANVRPEDLTIRWTSVPGSLYYDIRLVNAEGLMIWQDRIEETRWSLPVHLELLTGNQYFVRVDAYLAEAKSVSSRHVPFTIKRKN